MLITLIVLHTRFLRVRYFLVTSNFSFERVLRAPPWPVAYRIVWSYHSVRASRVALSGGENTILSGQSLTASSHIAVQGYGLMCPRKVEAQTKTRFPNLINRGSDG